MKFLRSATLFWASLWLVFLFLGRAGVQAQTQLDNPLSFVGVDSPEKLVARAFSSFAAIIGIIAIVFIVFNGFKLIIAGAADPAKDQKINAAKQGLLWSVGGFIIALLSFTLISGTAKFIGFDITKVGTDVLQNPLSGPAQPDDFVSVAVFMMANFLGILGFATIAVIIYYGYRYITSAGNEEAVKRAKSGLQWAIFGFVVTILAYTIVSSIQRLLVQGPPP